MTALALIVTMNGMGIVSAAQAQPADSSSVTIESAESAESVVEKRYHQVLEEWEKTVRDSTSFESAVSPVQFKDADDNRVEPAFVNYGYGEEAVAFGNRNEIHLDIEVPEDALYHIGFDFYKLGNDLMNPELSIKINGQHPFYESRRIIATVDWKNKSESFERNQYGNELIPEQVPVQQWKRINAQDPNFLQPDDLKFRLAKGKNTITLTNTRGEMLLGKVYVESPKQLETYEQYARNLQGETVQSELVELEAEHPFIKNSSFIRPIATQSIDVYPYSSHNLLLNTIGGESWASSGQSITWKFSVPQSGKYALSFKVLQKNDSGASIYRTISIDGQIPFQELKSYPFDYSGEWRNETLRDAKGNPFYIYLEAGEHELTLEADASPIAPVLDDLSTLMSDIGDLGLSVKKLTGSQTDMNREWEIKEYLPDIEDQLEGFISTLHKTEEVLKSMRGSNKKQTSDEAKIVLIIKKLEALKAKPNEIPKRLTDLSEGSSSAAQLIGDLQASLQRQPLLMDKIYVHGDVKLPEPQANFGKKVSSKFKEFFASFNQETYDPAKVDEHTLDVWVNRSQQYVELLQNMADSTFTKETGIPVKFSVMPNEQKLILANAGNQQPDIALGVSVGTPYELAIRGSAADLSKFPDFKDYIRSFSPGAFLPMMVDDKVYALPETQDFYVLFYRKDMLDKLQLPVPDTWDEVLMELPELQRLGMNFFVPLSGGAGNKAFMFTAPFIYQYGGELYAEDGMSTAIDSEESLKGIKLMTELYTLYSMPLQVPNFYNSFRYGTLPMGISNFETYVKLTSAAPEIAGSWDIALYPGVKQEDGSVSRWATGSAQSAMILEKSDKQEEAWQLLKWWMSTKTQSDYATNLQTVFGPEYMWNTANLEAFGNLPWPEEHKQTILEQWEWLKEVPKTPGAYMIEREISNVWNKVVFDGSNLRASVDDSTIIIDREIRRKMEEFGYMKDGQAVKPYIVPKLETVEDWVSEK
ncbi:extracellular solute-binding protein [Paenibacillus sp. 7541]|uniref:extracellular solute-binding protein n=1 Tax=Paenibacillus sp. 7541 TaxID=2026236 RepID=UPI00159548FF|nr:extracellular solute-binding protein [Paenibacillus sp. 7541]